MMPTELAIDVSDLSCSHSSQTDIYNHEMAAFQRLFRASLAPTAAIGAAVYATGATASADAGAAPLVSELIVNPGRTVRGDKVGRQDTPRKPAELY